MSWPPTQLSASRGALVLSAMLTSGCLVGAPIELEEPTRIAPSVFMDQVLPSLLSPVRTYLDPTLNASFRAPFISDDLSEPVWGKLYLDYNGSEFVVVGYGERAASTLDDQNREMVIEWTQSLNRPPGCHSVTMAITHKDNFGSDGRPIDSEMTAFVVWWVSHDSEFQDVTLYDCNQTGTSTL